MANETLGTVDIKIKIDWKKVKRSFEQISKTATKTSQNIDKNISKGMKSIPREAAVAASKTKVIFASMKGPVLKITNRIRDIFRSAFRSIVRIVSTAMLAVGAAMAGFAVFGTKLAIDAKEVDNLMEVSFGNMEGYANQWIDNFTDSLGLFKPAVKNYAATLNIMSKAMGLTDKQSLQLSENLTKRAFDLASLRNLKIEDAFTKITAALSGESEPLKRLGFIINETTTKNFAMTNGIIKQGEELTETQKVMARYGLIMKLTADAQNDLAKTADQPANQLRLLKERFKTAAAETGNAVLASESFKQAIFSLFGAITVLQPEITKLITKGLQKLDEFFGSRENIDAFIETTKEVGVILKNLGKVALAVGNIFLGTQGSIPILSSVWTWLKRIGIALLAIAPIQTIKLLWKFGKVLASLDIVLSRFFTALFSGGKILLFLEGLVIKVGAAFFSLSATLAGPVSAASVGIVAVLGAIAAAVGWLAGKGLVALVGWLERTFSWFNKLTDGVDWLISRILELLSLIPGMKTLGKLLGVGEVQSDPNATKSKDIGSIMSRKASNIPVANPGAVSTANAGKGMTVGDKALLSQLKQLTNVTAGAPAKEKMMSSMYSS